MSTTPEPPLLHRGDGPVATVYMTVPPAGGRAGAVKVYPEPLDKATATELLDEQGTLAALRSVSSILLIDHLGELPDGRAALRMELCAQSLAELVAMAGPLPMADVVGLAETLATVLADAHTAGIVHGGVTPTNVLFRSAGRPVLADFGLGLRQRFPRSPAAAAAYSAPEVLRGAEPLEPADLYGLGAVLYFALTGSAPFPARTGEPADEVLLRALGEPPPAISDRDLPPALSGLLTGLLAKDPAERPDSAEHVLDLLRELGEAMAAPALPGPGVAGPAGRGTGVGGSAAGGPITGGMDAASMVTGGPDAGEPGAGGLVAGGPDAGGPDAGGPVTGGPHAGGPDAAPRVEGVGPERVGGNEPAEPADDGPDFDDFRDELATLARGSTGAALSDRTLPPDEAPAQPSADPAPVTPISSEQAPGMRSTGRKAPDGQTPGASVQGEQLPGTRQGEHPPIGRTSGTHGQGEHPPIGQTHGPSEHAPSRRSGTHSQTEHLPSAHTPGTLGQSEQRPGHAPSAGHQDGGPPGTSGPHPKPQPGERQVHPALLATVAVLAVLAVLLGALGGGDDRTPEVAPPDSRPADMQPTASAGPEGKPDRDGSQAADDRTAETRTPHPPPDAKAMGLEIHQLEDHRTTVDLGWRSAEPLTYAVFVAKEGGEVAKTRYRGPATTMTIQVEPGLKYCFQVQGTDGTHTYESPPRAIRGATCQS